MKIKDLKTGIYYVLRVEPKLRITKELIGITKDEHQSADVPDTEYIVSEYAQSPFNQSSIMGQYMLYRNHYVYGEDLSQNLGIFVSKEELLEHIQNQLDKLP